MKKEGERRKIEEEGRRRRKGRGGGGGGGGAGEIEGQEKEDEDLLSICDNTEQGIVGLEEISCARSEELTLPGAKENQTDRVTLIKFLVEEVGLESRLPTKLLGRLLPEDLDTKGAVYGDDDDADDESLSDWEDAADDGVNYALQLPKSPKDADDSERAEDSEVFHSWQVSQPELDEGDGHDGEIEPAPWEQESART
eukprot:763959-Hanusia_phi.AAC.12